MWCDRVGVMVGRRRPSEGPCLPSPRHGGRAPCHPRHQGDGATACPPEASTSGTHGAAGCEGGARSVEKAVYMAYTSPRRRCAARD
jgi:hypothetical protein